MNLFEEELQPKNSKVRDLEKGKRVNVKSAYRDAVKTPQAVLKVTSYSKSSDNLKAHLSYISDREEEMLDLEDPNGNKLVSGEEFDDLIDQWTKDEKVYNYKNSNRGNRLTANIVLSAPENSDREKVTEAIRVFARKEFGETNDYVFAKHEDTANSHAHLVLKLRGYDGKKTRLGKKELYELRQSLAESMREQGIGVTASYRTDRGKWIKGIKQPIIHMRKRMRLEIDKNAIKEAAEDMVQPKSKPWIEAMEKKRQNLEKKYGDLAKSFELREDKAGGVISAKLAEFSKSIPKVETRNDQIKSQLEKTRNKDKDIER